MAKKNRSKGNPAPTIEQDPGDDDLVNNLLTQLDTQDEDTVVNEISPNNEIDRQEAKQRQSAKSRFQARQVRRAAALAQYSSPADPEAEARLVKEAADEEKAISKICKKHGRQMFQINPDGHCLYSAVAHQLTLLGKLTSSQATYVAMRAAAAQFIESHPDDFLPFLPAIEGEDTSTDPGLMSPSQFRQYCHDVRDSAVWGGEPEIQALSRAFNVPIYVVQAGTPPIVVHDPSRGSETDEFKQDGVWLSYHRRMYGLGEHYNSLRSHPPT
ncbi:hypothetical protein AGABI2DRAFT_148660 [Agaricus bisporus var. bisporus H97]|uniref:hypothetical protein n=1 Tax=Agaricus bisporus var. bisporus (strain H97 / ATCC MYA-4626 / FGSC 10389) TaxID=936046 RepID=UPI00029F7DB1|nr:hypothetical protein AGABI2DRAFT_148660 [Agaricus bisporus var. bisporus H97]EKV50120.1 hypothetical protein AGABI2DRAFT_148660 [Agaricus bisporus var. bisporus H97]